MTPFAYRLDAEAQAADNHATERAEHRDAERYDRTTWQRVNGSWLDADRVPHPSDCED